MTLITDEINPTVQHVIPNGMARPVGTIQRKGEYWSCSHWGMHISTTFWDKQKALDWVLNQQTECSQIQLRLIL